MMKRSYFGLLANRGFIVDLLSSPDDIGSDRWGIPMTREEEAAVDMHTRMRFADDAERTLLPTLRDLPEFAGAYFDQRRGGILVVHVTRLDVIAEQRLLEKTPMGPGVNVRLALMSFADLNSAYERAWDTWPAASDGRLQSVAIDERNNGLVLGVSGLAEAARVRAAKAMTDALNVDVNVVNEAPGAEMACTSPDSCTYPMKTGTRVRRGSSTSTTICTMGFHLQNVNTGVKQFVTAGHCGYQNTSSWYHQGYGLLGAPTANLYGPATSNSLNGQDIMRVQFPDAQVFNDIYNNPGQDVEGRGNPVTENRCA
jgi:hypothetical protein